MPFIYFICELGNTNCFKIGKTENHPADRMDQLQTGNPRKLTLYKWIKIDNHDIAEEYLHVVFNEYHIRGEWFMVSTEQIDAECNTIIQNNPNTSVSGAWEKYTDEDRLKVKLERKSKGKYKGKIDPIAAAEKKNKYLNNKNMNKMYNFVGFSDN